MSGAGCAESWISEASLDSNHRISPITRAIEIATTATQ